MKKLASIIGIVSACGVFVAPAYAQDKLRHIREELDRHSAGFSSARTYWADLDQMVQTVIKVLADVERSLPR